MAIREDTATREPAIRERQVALASRPSLAKWPAILSGAILSFLPFVILTSLWLALRSNSPDGFVNANFEWFELGTALFAAGFGAFMAGLLQDVRGVGAGMVTGMTVWGLVLFAALAIGIPTIFSGFQSATQQVLEVGGAQAEGGATGASGASSTELWAAFIAFAGGLIVSTMAGGAGGAARRAGRAGVDRSDADREHGTAPTRREHI